MKSLTVWIFCFMSLSVAYGQNNGLYLKVAYNGGMIINPGVSLGVGYSLLGGAQDQATLDNSYHELRIGISTNYYFHQRLNKGLSLGPEVAWIRTSKKGFQFGVVSNFGFLRTHIDNTFEVDDSGLLSKAKSSGNNHFFYDFGLRLGRTGRLDNQRMMEWYIQPKLQFQTPYFKQPNKYFLTEIGINYQIN
ncbi:MAG: hypothetical protein AAFO07_24650 [Bacteroidota bacterium]